MKRLFSRVCGVVLTAALTLSTLPIPMAHAAAIQVTLNDQPMSFSDAQPLMRENRTFVPFRAIFEGMGATVSWDNTTRTVIAKRGDRTVNLTIGQKNCKVDRAGSDRSFSIDAAPFIEGGRTYVPIRFAAQALGAAVGWDSSTQTVLLVDTEKLMQTEFSGQFQAITAMIQFAQSVTPTTARGITGSLGATITFHTAMGDIPAPISGTITGTESKDATQFTLKLQTDTMSIDNATAVNGGVNPVDANVTALLKKLHNTTTEGILSRVDGKLYLKSPILTNVQQGSWGMKPLDSAASLTAIGNGDAVDFVCAQAQQLTLLRGSTVSQVRNVVQKLSDQSASQPIGTPSGTSLHFEADTYHAIDMKLIPGQSLTIMQTASPYGAEAVPMITLTSVQSLTNTSITYEKNASTYNAAFHLDLNNGAATTAPPVRPS